MSRKTEATNYQKQIADLSAQIEKIKTEAGRWKEMCMKAEQEKGAAIADSLQRGKFEKMLLIINHITAGKPNEAIKELLQPLPVVIGVDIRFADDKTRIASEDETLERIKKHVIDSVSLVKFNRKPDDGG